MQCLNNKINHQYQNPKAPLCRKLISRNMEQISFKTTLDTSLRSLERHHFFKICQWEHVDILSVQECVGQWSWSDLGRTGAETSWKSQKISYCTPSGRSNQALSHGSRPSELMWADPATWVDQERSHWLNPTN